jgi:hypothetical protein
MVVHTLVVLVEVAKATTVTDLLVQQVMDKDTMEEMVAEVHTLVEEEAVELAELAETHLLTQAVTQDLVAVASQVTCTKMVIPITGVVAAVPVITTTADTADTVAEAEAAPIKVAVVSTMVASTAQVTVADILADMADLTPVVVVEAEAGLVLAVMAEQVL